MMKYVTVTQIQLERALKFLLTLLAIFVAVAALAVTVYMAGIEVNPILVHGADYTLPVRFGIVDGLVSDAVIDV